MILSVKLKSREHSADSVYKNKVNALDFRQIAIILVDLELNGLQIEKAISEFKNLKAKEFPW